MSFTTLVLFVAGLVLLIAGAEALVRGASRLARAARVSPLVIGLTVVAFGTSAPEMAVSVMGALRGQPDIAFGNVVGSNVFNILFILGASALVAPLVVAQKLVRVDVPLMIGTALATLLFALDGRVSRLEGGLLFSGLLAYIWLCVRGARREPAAVQEEYAQEFDHQAPSAGAALGRNGLLVLGGLALLVLGSRWLVDGAVEIARALGLSELIIGLTIVAAGTSLPEVATSLLAAYRGERDIAVGNVVGSNIFNVLGVLGAAAAIAPSGVPVAASALSFDVPVMIAAAVACLPVFFNGYRIARWEGFVFLAYYVAYVAVLVLDATDHDALPAFSWILGAFALPLTGLTLGVITWRNLRRR